MSAPRPSGIPRFVGIIPRPAVPAATAGAGLGAIPRRRRSPHASRLRQPGFGLRKPVGGLRQPAVGVRQPAPISYKGWQKHGTPRLGSPTHGKLPSRLWAQSPSASPMIEDTPRLDRGELRRKMRHPRKLNISPEWGIMSVSVVDSPTSPRRNILIPESTVTSGALAVPVEEAYDDVVNTDEVQRVMEETRNNAVRKLRRTEAKERREVKRQLVEAQTFRRQFISPIFGDSPLPYLAMSKNGSPSIMPNILEERMPLTAGIGREMIEDIELRPIEHPVAGGILDVWAGKRQLLYDLEREEPPEGFYDDSYEEEDWNRCPDDYYDLDPELKSQFFCSPQQGRYRSMADWNFPSTARRRRSSSPKRTHISPVDLIEFS